METSPRGPGYTNTFHTHSGRAGLPNDIAPVMLIAGKGRATPRAFSHCTQVLQSDGQKPQHTRVASPEPYLVTRLRSPQELFRKRKLIKKSFPRLTEWLLHFENLRRPNPVTKNAFFVGNQSFNSRAGNVLSNIYNSMPNNWKIIGVSEV